VAGSVAEPEKRLADAEKKQPASVLDYFADLTG
jgi:hypothetical protein